MTRHRPVPILALALALCATGLESLRPAVARALVPPPDASLTEADLRTRAELFERAQGALEAGDPATAARLYTEAGERFGSARALLLAARLHAGRGDAAGSSAARDLVRQALDLAPSSEEALSTFGRLALSAGDPLAALGALEPLARMHPDAGEHTYLFGVALLQVGDMPRAVETLEQAVATSGQQPLPRIALGLALNHLKRYAQAEEILTESLRLAPDNAEALAALAEAKEGLDKLDDAERYARRALDRDTGHPTANLVLGLVRMKQRRYTEARDAFETVIAREPSSPKAHYQLSLALARLGDTETSRHHLGIYRRSLAEREKLLLELRGQAPEDGESTP